MRSARTCNARSSIARPARISSATAITASTTSTAATSPVRRPARWKSTKRSRQRKTRTGGDHCLPQSLTIRPDQGGKPGWRAKLPSAFLFERLGLDSRRCAGRPQTRAHPQPSVFYFLGGMALFLFAIQVVTGILLALYYKPSPDQAFESVRAIVTEVDFGWLFRSIHSWSANC